MKTMNGIHIIGVDHGYGNIKTANYCFPTGVESSDTEPTFKQDLLIYEGQYYQIGIGHKEYAAEKIIDQDYYVLTLAAIARELAREELTDVSVYIAAGLPLSWVGKQKQAFKEYLLQNREVSFTYRNKEYHLHIVGAEVFPQGFAAIAPNLQDFGGSYMLCDIGNGTMNILRILNRKPDPKQMFTEKYGVHQCILALREALLRDHNAQPDEALLHSFLQNGTAGLEESLEQTMTQVAKGYAAKVFRKLREHGYDPRLMKLYVVGGGGCLLKNFCPIDENRVTINSDICATAKGYEYMATVQIRKGGIR